MGAAAMLRPLIACGALVLPFVGCGESDHRATTSEAPAGAAPVHPHNDTKAAAQRIAAYKTAVNDVLASYSTSQRNALASLRGAAAAPRFVAALKRLRRATVLAANRLEAAKPPAAAGVAHARFVGAFRSLAGAIQSAIDARKRSDFDRLRRVGRRLASGEFSRPITGAAKQIDAALAAP